MFRAGRRGGAAGRDAVVDLAVRSAFGAESSPVVLPASARSASDEINFPTSLCLWHVMPMRRPDPISLEETFLLFLLVIPMGYYAVWWLLALIAAL